MYWVYILASGKHGTLYIGVTNDLVRRIYQHKNKPIKGFTSHYNVVHLVWFEGYDHPTFAITREKELKRWRREWKINLIEQDNPNWDDLYDEITRCIVVMDSGPGPSGHPGMTAITSQYPALCRDWAPSA